MKPRIIDPEKIPHNRMDESFVEKLPIQDIGVYAGVQLITERGQDNPDYFMQLSLVARQGDKQTGIGYKYANNSNQVEIKIPISKKTYEEVSSKMDQLQRTGQSRFIVALSKLEIFLTPDATPN